jgi:hypothetical protein
MNATLTTFYLIQKIKQGFFLYYISCKEKINVGKIQKLRENCYLIILSIHILKLEISGEISGCDMAITVDSRQMVVYICDNPPRKIPYYSLRPIHFGR